MPKTTANNANRPAVLEVRLGSTVVGTLTSLPNDQNLFAFDPAYVADDNRPVLSLSFYDAFHRLITNVRPVTSRLPPFFSNLLPEGQLRQYIADHGEISAEREFFLLWLLGNDRSARAPLGVRRLFSCYPSYRASSPMTATGAPIIRQGQKPRVLVAFAALAQLLRNCTMARFPGERS